MNKVALQLSIAPLILCCLPAWSQTNRADRSTFAEGEHGAVATGSPQAAEGTNFILIGQLCCKLRLVSDCDQSQKAGERRDC